MKENDSCEATLAAVGMLNCLPALALQEIKEKVLKKFKKEDNVELNADDAI